VSSKTVRTDVGDVRIDVPRDRAGTFEPTIVPKHKRRLAGFDENVISLYAKGFIGPATSSSISTTSTAPRSPGSVEPFELLPDAQLRVLAGTTHVGMTRRANEVLALIESFLPRPVIATVPPLFRHCASRPRDSGSSTGEEGVRSCPNRPRRCCGFVRR